MNSKTDTINGLDAEPDQEGIAMSKTKNFHLSDVLCITTGRMVSTRHMNGIHDILGWMTGESLSTHQLPRVLREAEPVLSTLYPHLSGHALAADLDDLDILLKEASSDKDRASAALKSWLGGLENRFGSRFAVPKLDQDQHERIDPISEMAEKIHPDHIMIVPSDLPATAACMGSQPKDNIMSRTETMTVGRIDNQGDRILLYSSNAPVASILGEYHIIAPIVESENIKKGDRIIYEPYGLNFGWFVSKAS